MSDHIYEPSKKIKVAADTDLCVVGGSCTGVFAAVRAARLGLKVVLVERQNMLGGTATLGLVNYWHALHDINENKQIIAGLTWETLERLNANGALLYREDRDTRYNFSPWMLAIILDNYIKENKIKLMLYASYSAVIKDNGSVKAVIIEDPDGRKAIRAKFFIDATGDGRIARDLDIPSYTHEYIQPPTSCFHMQGDAFNVDVNKIGRENGAEFGLEDDWGWSARVASCDGITLRADNHVFGLRLDRAGDLTEAELEGRRKAAAFASMLKKYGDKNTHYSITALCSAIGIRETVHYKTRFRAKADDILLCKKYDSPILNGTYRVDIHHSHGGGITFKYLDGREETIYGKNTRKVVGNWREREGICDLPADYYQLPLDILICEEYSNFIPVGRMLNADMGAFGALRVMVNLNQLGEAAGVAAYICINESKGISDIEASKVTALLRNGGSAL